MNLLELLSFGAIIEYKALHENFYDFECSLQMSMYTVCLASRLHCRKLLSKRHAVVQ